MRTIRSLVYFLYLYAAMAVVATAAFPFALLRRRVAFDAARAWSRAAVWGLAAICGARLRYEGLENLPKGPALIASKHQAMLDIYGPLLKLDHPAFVLKQELLKMPAFGWFAVRAGMIPIDRAANASALRSMLKAARARIAEGRQVVIFPEGTRMAPGAPPDYKPGVAALYRDLNVPCVPVALDTARVWPASGFMRTPGVATIKFLPAIPPGLSRDDFMRELETRIETESAALLAA